MDAYFNHKALKGLTTKQIEQFEQIHKKHIAAWESEIRIEQHSLNNLKNVEWVPNENCFHAHYKRYKKLSPTWYHYTLDGNWY
jgi:hypothetical protein